MKRNEFATIDNTPEQGDENERTEKNYSMSMFILKKMFIFLRILLDKIF